MRTKDVNNGIVASTGQVEEPEGLDEFMISLAEQIKAFEQSSNTSIAANIVVRTVQNGEEHFVPLSYVRDTKPLCGHVRNGEYCARHSVDDVPQFLNIQDVSGLVNVYHPYDKDHMQLMHEINSGYLGDPEVDESPIDEFKVVFGELMLKNMPVAENSLLRLAAGKIKFWKGKLQDAHNRAKTAAANIKSGNDPVGTILKALGLNSSTQSTGISEGKPLTSEETDALDEAVAQAMGLNKNEIIDPNDPEEFAKLPPELQVLAKAMQGQAGELRFVKMSKDRDGVELVERGTATISDLDVSVIADPSKIVKSNKTVH